MAKSDAQFSGTKLLVDDLEATGRFYKAVCGLTEVTRVRAKIGGREIDEILFNFRGEGPPNFVLLKFVGAPRPTCDETINVFITEDLPAFVARALEHGGTLVDPPYDNPEHGVKVAFVKDVEGHLMEVVELL